MNRLIASLLVFAMTLACLCSPALALSSIDLPKALKVVEDEAFFGTSAMQKLVIPEGTQRLEQRSFASSGLREVYLPHSLEYIAPDAFDNCRGLTVYAHQNSYAHKWLALSDVRYEVIPPETAGDSYSLSGVTLFDETDENGVSRLCAGVYASVTKACSLVFRVLDDSEKLLWSTKVSVAAAEGEQFVSAPVTFALPTYYILEAQLVNSSGKPLCDPCRTMKYSEAYAQFSSTTSADYPKERVVSFGSSGYAVMADGVIPLNAAASQNENGSYTFSSSETLSRGDVILLDVSGTPTVIKVSSVTKHTGGRLTVVPDSNVRLDEMYDAVNISASLVGSAKSAGDPKGSAKVFSLDHSIAVGPLEVGSHSEMVVDLDFKYEKNILKDYELGLTFNFKGALDVFLGAEIDTWKDDLTGGLFSAPAIQIYNSVVIIPGINAPGFLNVSIPLNIKSKGGGTAELSYDNTYGFTASGKNGFSPIKEKSTNVTAELTNNFELMLGPEVSLTISLFGALNARIGGQFGVKMTGDLDEPGFDHSVSSMTADKVHACEMCVDMDFFATSNLRGTVIYDIADWLSGSLLDLNIALFEEKLGDAFYSVINEEDSPYHGLSKFALGECQNYKHRVTATAYDMYGKAAKKTPIIIPNPRQALDSFTGESPFKLYLYNGNYTATAHFPNMVTANESFTVNNEPVSVNIYEPAIDITGCVTDYTTGLPISGAEVVITLPTGDQRTKTTDSKGNYSETGLPCGDYLFSFSADGYIPQENIEHTFRTAGANSVDCELVPITPGPVGVPYATSEAWVSEEDIEMGGRTYSDAVIFRMGYTGSSSTGNTAVAAYNFKGKCSSMSFDAGFMNRWERNATMTIIADGRTIYDEYQLYYEDAPKRFTIPLSGVHQLIIRFFSNGYDKTQYAIGNISITPAPQNDERVRTCDADYDARRNVSENLEVYSGSFYMGGHNYLGGYRIHTGYGFTTSYEAKFGYKLDGDFRTFSFDIARHIAGAMQHYLRSAYLTIEVDGVPVAEYNSREIKWTDLVLPVNVNVSGASNVVVKLYSQGYDRLYWGVGNIHLTR